MPSPTEQTILLIVLGAVLASLPVALLFRRLFPARLLTVSGPPGANRGAQPYDTGFEGVPDFAGGEVREPMVPPKPAASPAAQPPPLPLHASWVRRDAWFSLVLLALISVLMGPLAALGMSGGNSEPVKMDFSPGLLSVQLVFQFGMVGLVLVYLVVHRRLNVTRLFGLRAMGPLRTVGVSLLWIVPGFVAIMFVAGVVVALIQHFTGMELKPQAIVEGARGITDPGSRALLFATLCIGAPVMEELIFRGVFFSVAAKYISRGYALVASGLFFAVIHTNLLSLVPLTLLGILFAVAYEKTRSLAVPVVMHALFNGTQFFLLMYADQIQKFFEQYR